jgi:lipoprotein-anchoring transpeptidase ErfK/SrfK
MMIRACDVERRAYVAALCSECAHLMERGEAAARAGNKAEARYFFETVLRMSPKHRGALLWLAYLAGGGRASLTYLARLLEVDPTNRRARAALLWVNAQARRKTSVPVASLPPRPIWRQRKALVSLLALIVVSGLVSVAFTGGVLDLPLPTPAWARLSTAVASLTPSPTETSSPTMTMTPAPSATPTPAPTETPTPAPSVTPTPMPSATPTDPPPSPTASPTPSPSPTDPPPTSTPGPTVPPPPTLSPTPLPTSRIGDSFRWIDIDLTHQRLIAYQGETPMRTVIVSTGLPRTPTVTGRFRIYVKYKTDHMSGPGYSLANVPYVMYFYGGYGLHGTYWHQNFGQPMSHGCVNLPTPEAEWLFNWASVGTLVVVHY